MPLSGDYNQKMAAIRLIPTAEYERLGPNWSVLQVSDLKLCLKCNVLAVRAKTAYKTEHLNDYLQKYSELQPKI